MRRGPANDARGHCERASSTLTLYAENFGSGPTVKTSASRLMGRAGAAGDGGDGEPPLDRLRRTFDRWLDHLESSSVGLDGGPFQLQVECTRIVRTAPLGSGRDPRSDVREIFTLAYQAWHPKERAARLSCFDFMRASSPAILDSHPPAELARFCAAEILSEWPSVDALRLDPAALAALLEAVWCWRAADGRRIAAGGLLFACRDDPRAVPDNCNLCDFDDRGAPVSPTWLADPTAPELARPDGRGHLMRGPYFGADDSPPVWGCRALLLDWTAGVGDATAERRGGEVCIPSCSDAEVVDGELRLTMDRAVLRERGGDILAVLPPRKARVGVSDFLSSIRRPVGRPQLAAGKHLLPSVDVSTRCWQLAPPT